MYLFILSKNKSILISYVIVLGYMLHRAFFNLPLARITYIDILSNFTVNSRTEERVKEQTRVCMHVL